MSNYRWEDLEPVTRQSITRLEDSPNGLNCGCERHDDRVWLCQYHVGMDDGAEAMATENQRLRAAVQAVRDMHKPVPGSHGMGSPYRYCSCEGITAPWPCRTIRALDGERDE